MKKKKVAKRVIKVTLDQFKTDLKANKYTTVPGARRAASYLSDTDKVVALKAIASQFGIGVDEPGTIKRGAKKISKATKPVEAAPVKLGVLKKKPGRPRKIPAAEAVLPTLAVASEPKKKMGRPRKVVAAEAEPVVQVRTPEPKKKISRKSDKLDDIGLMSTLGGTLMNAVNILRECNTLSGNKLSVTDGYQEIVDTTKGLVRALKPHVSALVHQDPPPPPTQGNGAFDRPYNQALLEAAALSVGVPLPGDDSVQ